MSQYDLHPFAEEYLRRLRHAARQLPPERRRELIAEIEGHLTEAIGPSASDQDALDVLERLGPPGEIIEAEQPLASRAPDRRSWREWSALILLPLGGFAFGVGWLVGLVLLWTSRLWTTRDKLVGTLIVPGGIATALLVLVLTGTKRRCTHLTGFGPSTGALVGPTGSHCSPSAGPGTTTVVLQVVLVAFFVLGPLVSAVYLARRARNGPALVAATRL